MFICTYVLFPWNAVTFKWLSWFGVCRKKRLLSSQSKFEIYNSSSYSIQFSCLQKYYKNIHVFSALYSMKYCNLNGDEKCEGWT